MEISAELLHQLKPESQDDIYVKNLDGQSCIMTESYIAEAYSRLRNKGMLSFDMVNFGWVLEKYNSQYGVDSVLCDVLFSPVGGHIRRQSIWDERSIARLMLTSGFYKVWTGRVEELPDHKFHVKGLRLDDVVRLEGGTS